MFLRAVAFVARCRLTASGLTAILGLCGSVAAMSPATLLEFDLARMPLHNALQQYSILTGRSVIYDSGRIAGRYSSALHGLYTSDEALRRMIAGSGMEVRHSTAQAVSLIVAPPGQTGRSATVPSTVSQDVREGYYGRLQARVRRLLCANAPLGLGDYRLVMQLRIAGRPPAIDVLHVIATERPELEPSVRRALHRQPVDAPPPGFGQPVTLLLTGRGPRGGGCGR